MIIKFVLIKINVNYINSNIYLEIVEIAISFFITLEYDNFVNILSKKVFK